MRQIEAMTRARKASREQKKPFYVVYDASAEEAPGRKYFHCDGLDLDTWYQGAPVLGMYEDGRLQQ